MVVRVIYSASVLIFLKSDFINRKIDYVNDVVALQREISIVGNWLIIVELYEEFIVLKALHYLLNHGEMIRSANVILVAIVHHILHKVKFKHSIL